MVFQTNLQVTERIHYSISTWLNCDQLLLVCLASLILHITRDAVELRIPTVKRTKLLFPEAHGVKSQLSSTSAHPYPSSPSLLLPILHPSFVAHVNFCPRSNFSLPIPHFLVASSSWQVKAVAFSHLWRFGLPLQVKCNAQTLVSSDISQGTPVRPTNVLVVGATGTLGRQIVRKALDEGYDVRCLVRPRPAPADFLRDWGAIVVNGDLSKPETIPATLVGVHTIIDCATGRPEEPIRKVDWEGKVALIQCAKAMGIQKYVFYSIHNCDKHPEVPLMEIKYCTEKFLEDSGLNHIIIRLCGFMQGLIGQYAVPILEEKSVWGTDAPTRIAYMDTQDIARLTLIAMRNEKVDRKLLTFAGPRAWTTQEVITLCERLAGQDANVTTVPVSVLKLTRQLTRLFQWTNDVADRLAFSEVLSSDVVFSAPMNDTYSLIGVDSKDIITLEKYLQDYFTNILKKLKDLKAQSKQTDIYF
ncbi:hypothetical protein IEQ34_007694 [Dendrobium chrysotoxum]|uniref:NmrA-like domain-containing protein n=1 Tax=Dendrobium chrysotoxum TaxID=161865 RepID=A0AAV7H5G9_DENCH|nr:hypothetical protein IEQ34_007694 [Dendrobium chrysotoxum]